MLKPLFLIGLVLAVGQPVIGTKQASKPDLNGRWVLDKAVSELDSANSGWFGDEVVIAQNEKSITFTGAGTSVYEVSGTVKKTPLRGATREDWMRWDNDRLLLLHRSVSERVDPA